MNLPVALIVYWCSALLILYTLAGYPMLLKLASFFWGRGHNRENILPRISIIIAAHNSEKIIAQKLENTLQSSYPADRREIIVASDSSTDGTNHLVASFSGRGVKLAAVAERRGKHYAQMVALRQSSGDVLIFTDSSVHLEPDAFNKICANFADPTVGCVSSEDRLLNQHSSTGEGTYVPAEMQLRRMEARISSVVGVSGSFFAARRSVCTPWHTDQSSDFFVPLHCVTKRLRAIVDPDSLASFGTVGSSRSEFDRKVRTIVHGLVVFFHHLYLLDPFRYGFFSVQFLSHKFLRWVLPFALIAVFASNVFLFNSGALYSVSMGLQILGYSIAILGLASDKLSKIKIFKLAVFFTLTISATAVAWLSFVSGEKFVTWEPSRR